MTDIDSARLAIVSGGMPSVAQLAYRRWEQAGRPMGRDQEFWQKAQRESRFRPSCPCAQCCKPDVWLSNDGRSYVDPRLKLSDLDPHL